MPPRSNLREHILEAKRQRERERQGHGGGGGGVEVEILAKEPPPRLQQQQQQQQRRGGGGTTLSSPVLNGSLSPPQRGQRGANMRMGASPAATRPMTPRRQGSPPPRPRVGMGGVTNLHEARAVHRQQMQQRQLQFDDDAGASAGGGGSALDSRANPFMMHPPGATRPHHFRSGGAAAYEATPAHVEGGGFYDDEPLGTARGRFGAAAAASGPTAAVAARHRALDEQRRAADRDDFELQERRVGGGVGGGSGPGGPSARRNYSYSNPLDADPFSDQRMPVSGAARGPGPAALRYAARAPPAPPSGPPSFPSRGNVNSRYAAGTSSGGHGPGGHSGTEIPGAPPPLTLREKRDLLRQQNAGGAAGTNPFDARARGGGASFDDVPVGRGGHWGGERDEFMDERAISGGRGRGNYGGGYYGDDGGFGRSYGRAAAAPARGPPYRNAREPLPPPHHQQQRQYPHTGRGRDAMWWGPGGGYGDDAREYPADREEDDGGGDGQWVAPNAGQGIGAFFSNLMGSAWSPVPEKNSLRERQGGGGDRDEARATSQNGLSPESAQKGTESNSRSPRRRRGAPSPPRRSPKAARPSPRSRPAAAAAGNLTTSSTSSSSNAQAPSAAFAIAQAGVIALASLFCFVTCVMLALPIFVHFRHPHEELVRQVPYVLGMKQQFGWRLTSPACARCAYKHALNRTLVALDAHALERVGASKSVRPGSELAMHYLRHKLPFESLDGLARAHHMTRYRARLYARSRDATLSSSVRQPLRDAWHYALERPGLWRLITAALTLDVRAIFSDYIWEGLVCLRHDEKLPCPSYNHVVHAAMGRVGVDSRSATATLFTPQMDDAVEAQLRDVLLDVIEASWSTNTAFDAMCTECELHRGGVGVDAISDEAAASMSPEEVSGAGAGGASDDIDYLQLDA